MKKSILMVCAVIIALCTNIDCALGQIQLKMKGKSGNAATDSKVWDGTVAKYFAGGSGTQNDPYLISNAQELALLAKFCHEKDAPSNWWAKLTSDIVLNENVLDDNKKLTKGKTKKRLFYYISGKYNSALDHNNFKGHFDGDGHTIYGVYGKPLFDKMNEVKNLHIRDSYIEDKRLVGGIAKYSDYVENCTFDGVVKGQSMVAGIVSRCQKIVGCVNYGNVYSSKGDYNFGICSGDYVTDDWRFAVAIVENCVNLGITSHTLVYSMDGRIVRNCYASTNSGFKLVNYLGRGEGMIDVSKDDLQSGHFFNDLDHWYEEPGRFPVPYRSEKHRIAVIDSINKVLEAQRIAYFNQTKSRAEANDKEALYQLGLIYLEGELTDKNDKLAFSCFQKAANLQLPDAQVKLGDCYYDGIGTAKNYKTAFTWYQKAANQGNTTAYCCLGLCYESGNGVVKNYNTAFSWYKKAEDAGNPVGETAYHNLERTILKEKAAPYVTAGEKAYKSKLYNKAIESFEAADGIYNDPYHYYYIGLCYNKLGDTENAARYLRMADNDGYYYARKELADIEFKMGKTHYKEVEYPEALACFNKAYEYGNADAANYLGLMYDNGQGVVRNDYAALDWFEKAKDGGCTLAVANYNSVKQRIAKREADERQAQENERMRRENEQRLLDLQRQANEQQSQLMLQQQLLITEQQATREAIQKQQQQGGQNTSVGSSSTSSSSSRRIDCAPCNGTGKCRSCAGNGYKIRYSTVSHTNVQRGCDVCHGSGRCSACHGKGYTY